jgi:putative ABC transport system permease protein
VQPQLGRAILPEEDEPGKNHVVVLSDGVWRRRFGGDPRIVGSSVQLNGESYQVVGVMPPGFRGFFNRQADIWTPVALTPEQLDRNNYTNEYLNLTARLKPGATLASAQAEMRAFADQLKRDNPGELGAQWTLRVKSLDELATGRIRTALLVLLGAVAFVLLIACANVANLLLARAAARGKEVAIRSALGADRWSLVRQLLAESVVLSLAGGVLGLVLAWWSVRTLVVAIPNLPRASEIGVDGGVMLFTLVVSLATGLLFGLAPALHVARTDLQSTLREGGRSGAADVSGSGLRRALVVAEMALALTLLVGAGLLIRSVGRLQGVDPGFDPSRLLTFNMAMPRAKYASDTAQIQFLDQTLAAIAATPGVRAVGSTSTLPFGGSWSTGSFDIEGYQPPADQPGPWGDIRIVSPGFFEALRIPLRRGRLLDARDGPEAPPVAVVDDELVRRYFRNEDPIGKRITFGPAPGDSVPRWITIVGVVGHTMHEGLDADARIQVYLSYRQRGIPFASVAVRAAGDPLALTGAVRAAVQSVDRDMPLSAIQAMDEMVEASLGQRRVSMLLLGTFSAIALLLASLGIYGVMSYSVTQRQRELGIRMALGAARRGVLGLVVRQGMTLALTGVAIGVVGALALTRLLAGQLYEVTATDPATFVVVALTLSGVALAAVLVPGLRATRVDPGVVLREE